MLLNYSKLSLCISSSLFLSMEDHRKLLRVLEAAKRASRDLQNKPVSVNYDSNSTIIEPLLELEIEAQTILSTLPYLFNLSQHLQTLKSLLRDLEQFKGYSFRSIFRRRLITREISRVASSIEAELQAWIDRESVAIMLRTLDESTDEDAMLKLMNKFVTRVSLGFDRDLQNLILKTKIFEIFEAMLCDSNYSKRIREQSALAIAALVRFNKNVFVGLVLMGPTIRALISMASNCSIQVLSTLIKLIRSPLVDEIESNGEIPKIISLLSYDDLLIRAAAIDCILEIGYCGRKEAVEAMIEGGVIEKLMELQRMEDRRDSNETESNSENEEVSVERQTGLLGNSPFASCVARFSIQLEVGEGLSKNEKKVFKLEILRRVREASSSEAEAASVVAEVLWGSSP